MREIIAPTIRGLAADGTAYTRIFICRTDDRGRWRAEGGGVQLPPRRSGDAAAADAAAQRSDDAVRGGARRRLDRVEAQWDPRAALGVVLAAAGYPEQVRSGDAHRGTRARQPHCRARCSTPARTAQRGRGRSPAADACCAPSGWGRARRATRSASAYALVELHPLSTACSIGATSAISDRALARGPRRRWLRTRARAQHSRTDAGAPAARARRVSSCCRRSARRWRRGSPRGCSSRRARGASAARTQSFLATAADPRLPHAARRGTDL